MTHSCAFTAFAVLLSGSLFGQSKFDIADVHVSPHTTNPNMRGGVLRAGRYEIRTATMVDLIATAYGIDADKVLSGPSWLESDRFDVIAKAPPSTPPETVKLMLQALLVERFKLVVRHDTKLLPTFALSVGKGKPKLNKADGSGEPGCKYTLGAQGDRRVLPLEEAGPMFEYVCHSVSMEAFAGGMQMMPVTNLGNNPILDKTGLEGSWDFTFKYSLPIRAARNGTTVAAGGASAPEIITFLDAIDKQLGLKLDPVKAPISVIVVDSVNQKPTENLPGVTTSLPVLPVEFEVADVKPTAPDFQGLRLQIQPGGRVNISGMTVKFVMQQAWNLTDEMIVGGPKWTETDRFDIIAKAPLPENTGAPSAPAPLLAPAGPPPLDIDTVWAMLRALLADRFNLKTHMEERPVSAYTLTAVKPKLAKADPQNRTGCKEGPGPDGKDPRIANPILSRLVSCQNMTMAQFTEALPNLAGGYVHAAVLDSTGLDGAYDFTLNFSGAGQAQGGGGRSGEAQVAGAGAASDPNGAISLPDAVAKQLGLKLELQKRPLPVLVIDHVEKPTDN